MSDPGALCLICNRRARVVGYCCTACVDRISKHLDPANRGTPFDPENPTAPVRPAGIAVLYRELADLQPDLGESEHEHADAAEVNEHHIALRDARSKATGPGRDDDGLTGPPSVLATLGDWARVVHEEHLDLEGRPDRLPRLALERTQAHRLYGSLGVALPEPHVQAVETLCRWLHARLEWLAAQPWVDELVTDLRRLTAALNAGRGEPGQRPLGRCRVLVDDDGRPCEDGPWMCHEPLFMPPLPPRAPDEEPVPPAMVCNGCGTRVSGLELLEYAREQGIGPGQS
jgi:hypothetical protein